MSYRPKDVAVQLCNLIIDEVMTNKNFDDPEKIASLSEKERTVEIPVGKVFERMLVKLPNEYSDEESSAILKGCEYVRNVQLSYKIANMTSVENFFREVKFNDDSKITVVVSESAINLFRGYISFKDYFLENVNNSEYMLSFIGI